MTGRFVFLGSVLLTLAALIPQEAVAQWSASPGETVRNAFGPVRNQGAAVCRGACGVDCPSSCDSEVKFECTGDERLVKVRSYSCGTHQACRAHDDCLDRCAQKHGEGYDCSAECHTQVVNNWGVEQSGAWALGGGPFDGPNILFEYSKDTPSGPEPIYRCPDTARLQCSAGQGSCMAGSKPVDPVFESYSGGANSIRVSGFRSGRVCTSGGQPSSVCRTTVDIEVTGNDRCPQSGGVQSCTWFGFELDYQGANSAEPLICQTSAAEEDFLGSIVSGAIKNANTNSDSDFGKLLGGLQKELQSGKSLDQVFSTISITTEDGQVLGGQPPPPEFQAPGVPSEVALNGSSGHLLVPMFELKNASPPGTSLEHQVRCTLQGQPVIETTFRLHFAAGN